MKCQLTRLARAIVHLLEQSDMAKAHMALESHKTKV